MGFEIEIKAHVGQDEVARIKAFFDNFPQAVYCGATDKYDVYWAKAPDDPPLLRTRLEKRDASSVVLFTSKPLKYKEYQTEYNLENEFCAPPDQWERIQGFIRGLGLVICREKWKKGYGYSVPSLGFDVHVELLDVRFLGWFLEMEVCADREEDIDKARAEQALFDLYGRTGLKDSALEPVGYNKLLAACGHVREQHGRQD